MSRAVSILLVAQATWELLRYDLVMAFVGFRRIHWELTQLRAARVAPHPDMERAVREAIGWALTLYWKRVRCLQRSIVTARLLRRNGISAELVIGYRNVPFFCHAWIEIDGRVANDSPAYKKTLHTLERT